VASATVVGLTAAGLGAVFWQAAQRAMREPPPPAAPPPQPQEIEGAAQTYLRSRAHQLREDLALGAGPTIEELASLARIRRENLGTFGRLLRAHRQELLALADARALTPQRAVEWLRLVGEIASSDPRIEEDRRAFMAAYEAGETGP
jgi:predicted component of type VI protein secretion system